MIRVTLPFHLRTLAGVNHEVSLDVSGTVTQRSILDALEARYPQLRGTIRIGITGFRTAHSARRSARKRAARSLCASACPMER